MQRTNGFPIRFRLVALLAAGVMLAGCGASSDAVLDAIPSRPTVAVPTTDVPVTTQAPTTEAPTTTEKPASTTLPSTTAPATTSGGSGSLPSAAKDAFMGECTAGADKPTCECIWSELENQLSIGDLLAAGENGSLPPDIEKKVIDATMQCMTLGGA